MIKLVATQMRFFKVLLLIIAIELISEFFPSTWLHTMGFQSSSSTYYSVKLIFALIISAPLSYLWVVRESLQLKRIRARLDSSLAQWQSFFHHSPDAVYLLDLQGKIINANPACEGMFGYAPDELRKLSIMALTPWHERKRIRQSLEISRESLQHFDTCIIHRDGRYVDVEVTRFPMIVDGELQGIFCIDKDISKRKRAESELCSTKDLLESFVYNSCDAISVFGLDGTIQQVNPAYERMFGCSSADLVDRNIPFMSEKCQNEFSHIIEHVQRGKSLNHYDTVRNPVDGRFINVSMTASPVRDAYGNVTAVAAIIRDISDQTTAQNELRATQEMLESFVNNTSDAITVLDVHGNVLSVNPAYEKMFGWTEEETLGRQLPIVPERSHQEYRERLDIVYRGECVTGVETVRQRKDGKFIDVNLSVSPIRDINNQVRAIAAVYRDVTELKQAQDLLRQSDKLHLAGQFAAGIAHEIRNPLTSIKGFMQLASQGQLKQLPLGVILSEISRIENILNEFLLLAKPVSQVFQKTDLNALIHGVVTLLETQAILNNCRIQLELDNNAPPLSCDPNQLKQVFINLVKNAIEAMATGGIVSIHTLAEKDHVHIRIKDNGCGIPDDVLERMGEPFYTTKAQGTGLGLVISHRIIETHRGHIQISSRPQHGTTVKVSLPVQSIVDDAYELPGSFALHA